MNRSDDVPDVYLGDGVWASTDGYHVWLDLRSQDPSLIAIGPAEFVNLLHFAAKVWDATIEIKGNPPETPSVTSE